MRIEALTSAGAALPSLETSTERGRGQFVALLRQNLANLVAVQAGADRAAQSVALGNLEGLHQAVIAMQEASLALDFTLAVRNHIVDGIEELLRTQV